MAVPVMSIRPRTSALRMPSTHPAIRNANHRQQYRRQLCLNDHFICEGQTIQLRFQMKQSGHLNPSEETGTGCPVTSKYGRTLPNKHGGMGGQQQAPSCLCSMYVRIGVQSSIFGDFDLCLSFGSCIVMMSCYVQCAMFFSTSVLFLVQFMLI